jgi:hypothetical protein
MPAILIKGGFFYCPSDYAQLMGYTSVQPIYRALRAGRIPGSFQIEGRWLIPSDAIVVNRSVRHGAYIGVRKLVAEHKKKLLDTR